MKRVKTKKKTGMPLEEKVKFLEKRVAELEKTKSEVMALSFKTIFAIELIDMEKVLGWGDKRISDRIYSQLLLFEELSSGRNTPLGMIKDAKWHTGVDIDTLLEDILEKEITPEHIMNMIKKNKNKKL